MCDERALLTRRVVLRIQAVCSVSAGSDSIRLPFSACHQLKRFSWWSLKAHKPSVSAGFSRLFAGHREAGSEEGLFWFAATS